MTLLPWKAQFATGVPEMDSQHRILVEALNELHSTVMKGAARNSTGPLLRSLIAYTRNHYAAEERLMARMNYPQLAQHRVVHQDLMRTLEGCLARFERGEIAITLEFLHFLRDWLSNHILEVDGGYRPWVRSNARPRSRPIAASVPQSQPSSESWAEANNGAALGSVAKS